MGPRAGRAHDRPAHARGGLRAGRRGAPPRRRQAARRARRRPLPGPLPVAAARGARGRVAGRGRRARAPEADPPPPARLRRGRGRGRGEVLRQLGRDQGHRGRPRARDLRRGAREPAVAALRPQGPAARRVDRLRRRRAAVRRGRRPARGAGGRRPIPTRASRPSATCSSPPSTSRASCKVDPELALRSSADRFRARVEAAERLAEADGARWNDLADRAPDQLLRAGPTPRRGRDPTP